MQGLPFSKSGYIDDLMKIESFTVGDSFGLVTGYLRNHLIQKYPTEWKAIHLELDAKGYKETLAFEKKESKKERAEEREWKSEEKEELEKNKEEWVKCGGSNVIFSFNFRS